MAAEVMVITTRTMAQTIAVQTTERQLALLATLPAQVITPKAALLLVLRPLRELVRQQLKATQMYGRRQLTSAEKMPLLQKSKLVKALVQQQALQQEMLQSQALQHQLKKQALLQKQRQK
jgi:hypothetical protein